MADVLKLHLWLVLWLHASLAVVPAAAVALAGVAEVPEAAPVVGAVAACQLAVVALHLCLLWLHGFRLHLWLVLWLHAAAAGALACLAEAAPVLAVAGWLQVAPVVAAVAAAFACVAEVPEAAPVVGAVAACQLGLVPAASVLAVAGWLQVAPVVAAVAACQLALVAAASVLAVAG